MISWRFAKRKGFVIMSKIIIENLLKMNIDRQKMIANGFKAQKYDDVLRGHSSYKLDDIIKISEKFRLTFDYLVYGKEKNSIIELTEVEQKMLLAFRKLSDEDKLIEIGRCEAILERNNLK